MAAGARVTPRAARGAVLIGLALLCACAREPASPRGGAAACGDCHAAVVAAWQTSLHARAATAGTAGELPAAALTGREQGFASVRFRPERAGDGVRLVDTTDAGSVGYPVPWVLGARDVVQPLVAGPRGRWQAFPAAWDPHAGGWFDVFPEAPAPADWTHWRGPGATANTQCLECHMTGYAKGFDLATDRYTTTWDEAGVGCAACHGDGAAHVRARRAGTVDHYGTTTAGGDSVGPGCVFCHARRVPLTASFDPQQPTLDQLTPVLLDDPEAFHADGQLAGESYEWASFQMSRMAAEGVRCGDCHEPHAGTLRQAGNALCLSCHEPSFDTAAHTHHPADTAGAACVGCHMPAHVFMERDVRRDHQIAVPDPTTAAAVGAPDACTTCHTEQSQAWAATQVATWWGRGGAAARREEIAVAIHRGRRGDPAALHGLVTILTDIGIDPLRRASAARLLEAFADDAAVQLALRAAVRDPEPLVRAGAATALGAVATPAAEEVTTALHTAVADPVRLVRTEAAFALRAVPGAGEHDAALTRATDEWLAAQAVLGELPEAHFNTGVWHAARGERTAAERAYRRALARWPTDRAPRYNLALLLAEMDRGDEAVAELETLRAAEASWPPVLASLGLLRAERGEWAEAVAVLEDCVRLAPRYPRAAYNLGLAYVQVGNLPFADHALELAMQDPAARTDALRERIRVAYHRGDRALVERLLPEAIRADPVLQHDPRLREALGAGE